MYCFVWSAVKPKDSGFTIIKDKKNQPKFMFEQLWTDIFGICLKKRFEIFNNHNWLIPWLINYRILVYVWANNEAAMGECQYGPSWLIWPWCWVIPQQVFSHDNSVADGHVPREGASEYS